MGLLGILYTHYRRSMNKWEKITLLGEKGCVYVMYLKVNLKIISKCCQGDLSKYV